MSATLRLPNRGEDALLDDLAVESGRARLQVAGGVFVEETPGEVGHGRAARLAAGRLPIEVAAGPREGDDLRGARPRGCRSDGSVRSDGGLDGASLVTVLDDVDLPAAGVDTNAETLDVVVPQDPFAFGITY